MLCVSARVEVLVLAEAWARAEGVGAASRQELSRFAPKKARDGKNCAGRCGYVRLSALMCGFQGNEGVGWLGATF